MGDVEYRALEPEDDHLFESAERIYENSWGGSDYIPDEDQIAEWVNNPDQDFFVAFEETELVGSALIDYGSIVEFAYDAVKRKHQGQGIGSGLFEARKKATEIHGSKKLFAAATTHHTGSQKIYERNGFTPVGIIVGNGKNTFDDETENTVVLMSNYLEETKSKDINVPIKWQDFVDNRLKEIPEIGPRNYSGFEDQENSPTVTNFDGDFIVDFVYREKADEGEDIENISNEVENFSSDNRAVYVDLSAEDSSEMVNRLQGNGLSPCGYMPHWFGVENRDYIVVQDPPKEPIKAKLTDSSLEVFEGLDLVQEKEKQEGDWVTLLG